MNYATHFISPQQKKGSVYVRMLCGKIKNSRTDLVKVSENPAEITCTKCLGFADNPARTLRKYGHVRLIEPYGFTLSPAWGFNIDVIVFTTASSGQYWRLFIKHNTTIKLEYFEADTIKDAIKYVIKTIETEILNTQPV